MLTVFRANAAAMAFYAKMRYAVDESSPSMDGEDEPYEILSKVVDAAGAAAARARAALLGDGSEGE